MLSILGTRKKKQIDNKDENQNTFNTLENSNNWYIINCIENVCPVTLPEMTPRMHQTALVILV